MKRIYTLCLLAAICLVASCSKNDRENTPVPFTGTNAISYNWTLNKYDGAAVSAPQSGMFNATATSSKQGNVHFVRTLNAVDSNIEDATFILSNGDTRVNFTKTDGNYGVLTSGGTWTIDSLTSSVMVLRSQYNLVMRFTK